MFEQLSEKLEGVFARLRGRGMLTEADIKEGLREVRRVLLEADVNFQLTREFLEHVEQKALGVAQLRTVSPAQQLVKIVFDELTAMLGAERSGLKLEVWAGQVVEAWVADLRQFQAPESFSERGPVKLGTGKAA